MAKNGPMGSERIASTIAIVALLASLGSELPARETRGASRGSEAKPRPAYPEFSWDRIPLYMHNRKATSYTDK
jgi:hypothetical protein